MKTALQTVLDNCLQENSNAPKIDSISQWRNQWALQTKESNFALASVAAAVSVGFYADGVAWAFLCGYQAAIRRMLSANDINLEIPAASIVSFSVSEKLGNRPRDLSTSVAIESDGKLLVNGAKSWVVAGDDCDWLIVSGVNQSNHGQLDAGELLDIRLFAVAGKDTGVSFVQNPPTQFIPEVVHGGVTLEQVSLPADRLLPGDGHQRYVKPFRSLEDSHIAAAILAYLVRCGRYYQWPNAVTENHLSLIVGMDGLSALDPSLPSTHLALTGLLAQVQESYDAASTCWQSSANAGEAAARWERDRALFDVAKKVRQVRADRAWSALGYN